MVQRLDIKSVRFDRFNQSVLINGRKVVMEVSNEEMTPFSESLDQPSSTSSYALRDRESMEPLQGSSAAPSSGNMSASATLPSGNAAASSSSSPSSMDARFDAENQQLKLKAWREGPFATGFVPATWEEEYANYRQDARKECMRMVDNDNNKAFLPRK